MPFLTFLPIILILIACAAAAYLTKKLTLAGAATGVIVGLMIFLGGGYCGVTLLAAFFVLGTLATSWKKQTKQLIRSKPVESTRRDAFQVLANGGVSAVIGLVGYCFHYPSWQCNLLIAGSLSAATADTLSSELGMVCGRRFYNILTFKKDEKGLDGVVSIEGTLIGVAGSALIAAIYGAPFGWRLTFLFIIVAGFIGNLVDSLLGACLERKGYIKNDMVNLLNTLTGALIVWLLMILFNVNIAITINNAVK